MFLLWGGLNTEKVPEEAVKSTLMEIPKTQLDILLSNLT